MATLQDGRNINIFQYRDHLDHITLSQHCVFDEPSRAEVSRLPIVVQRKTVHHIRRDIAIIGADITDLDVPSVEMRIRTRVYFDGLTKDIFIQRSLLTMRALSFALDAFALALEEFDSSVEVEVADRPAEQALNVVRFRPREKMPAEEDGSRTIAS